VDAAVAVGVWLRVEAVVAATEGDEGIVTALARTPAEKEAAVQKVIAWGE
jgi:hypothetical protein